MFVLKWDLYVINSLYLNVVFLIIFVWYKYRNGGGCKFDCFLKYSILI